MKLFLNFVIFWILITYSISIGDPFGILISLVGFLIMMVFIEELEESSNNLEETIWQSKEEIQPTRTNRLKKERNKAD